MLVLFGGTDWLWLHFWDWPQGPFYREFLALLFWQKMPPCAMRSWWRCEICQGVNHGQLKRQLQNSWNLSIHDSWQLMSKPPCSSSPLAMLALSPPQQNHQVATTPLSQVTALHLNRALLISGLIRISEVAENQMQHHWASSSKPACNIKLVLVLLQCKLWGGAQSY